MNTLPSTLSTYQQELRNLFFSSGDYALVECEGGVELVRAADIGWSEGHHYVEKRGSLPVFRPYGRCSPELMTYLRLRDALLVIRRRSGGYWTREEEPVISDMDDAWCELSVSELAEIRGGGSWLFAAPPVG